MRYAYVRARLGAALWGRLPACGGLSVRLSRACADAAHAGCGCPWAAPQVDNPPRNTKRKAAGSTPVSRPACASAGKRRAQATARARNVLYSML